MYLDDPGYELNSKQIYILLHLFGVQTFSLDVSARTTPRSAEPGTLESGCNQLADATDHATDVEKIDAS
jgi:hypothetical protein